MTTRLQVDHATIGYGDRSVIQDLDISVTDGSFTVIIGPNACGKSTLLRSMARLLKPTAGIVSLDGKNLEDMSSRAIARILGLLPQSAIAPDGIRVRDLVARGRFPHRGFLARNTPTTSRSSTRRSRRPARQTSPTASWTNCPGDNANACGSRWSSPRRPTSSS